MTKVMRTWSGVIRTADRGEYRDYIAATGLDGYRSTPFAGDDIEVARFYPEDDRFLVERELTVKHYDVVG